MFEKIAAATKPKNNPKNKTMLYTYTVFQDHKEIIYFKDQKNDFCVLKWFMNKTSNSMSYAFKYDGYKCTVKDQKTNLISEY